MVYDNIERAKRIKEDIETLQAEIKHIESVVNSNRFTIEYLMANLLKKKPKNKTYKCLWCSYAIDSVNSCITVNDREAMAVVEVKRAEIEELKKQIDKL